MKIDRDVTMGGKYDPAMRMETPEDADAYLRAPAPSTRWSGIRG